MVGITQDGLAYAHCGHCGAFETRGTKEHAQRWLDLHTAFDHTAGGCPICA